ncbi:hypothetical protein C1645_877997, partial [Glomus cerebriforme]
MSCQLITDCLNEIFECLDDKTLHSCLFVNRLCCKISIGILWRNIYDVINIKDNDNIRRRSLFFLSTILACLPDESKEFLLNNEISISTLTSKPPLFNYPAFCKVLLIDHICLIVYYGLEEIQEIPITSSLNKKSRYYLVINEVIKMFITQISSLKKLTFYDSVLIPNNISFTCFSGAINCLTDLSELHCISSLTSEFFYPLSKICHNIHSLTITLDGWIRNELKELISLQNNLKDLRLSVLDRRNLIEIIPILTKHSNTLTKLHFNGSYYYNNLSVSFISLFSNLQEIKFSRCFSIIYYRLENQEIQENLFEDFEKLQYVTFPKLQYLSIPFYCTNPEYIIKFLENNGKNLQEFYLEEVDLSFIALFPNLQEIKFSYTSLLFGGFQFRDFEKLQNVTFPKLKYLTISYGCTKPEYVMKFLENNGKNLQEFYLEEVDRTLNSSIAKFCPNLKKLSIVFSELDILRNIFNNCQYLKSIKILCEREILSEKEVLEIVSKYSPKNFHELKIYNYLNSKLLPKDLESFFYKLEKSSITYFNNY